MLVVGILKVAVGASLTAATVIVVIATVLTATPSLAVTVIVRGVVFGVSLELL